MLQFLLGAALPVGAGPDDFIWHNSFFGKKISSWALPLNPSVLSSLIFFIHSKSIIHNS
jgi:hypothetical protein